MKAPKAHPTPEAPRVGQVVVVYGKRCRIVRVRPFGTIDVMSLDGTRAWRLSGLSFGGGS